MRHNRNTIIIRSRAFAAAVALGALAFAAQVFAVHLLAHEGFDHVTGTIAKVAGNVVTVKTTAGNVDVKLDSKTEITKNDQKAQVADLKIGTRVVVDVPEDSKDKVAHSVKIGVSTPAKTTPAKPSAATSAPPTR
jgi:hypothetical protein